VYTLYSLSRELTGTLREMRTTLAELRGGSSMKTCSSLARIIHEFAENTIG
jgi:hypothetical protein